MKSARPAVSIGTPAERNREDTKLAEQRNTNRGSRPPGGIGGGGSGGSFSPSALQGAGVFPSQSGRPRGERGGRGRGGEDGDNRYEERVVKINRCVTVVKGGRRFSFSALVVLGDRSGQVGVGFGKANEVPPSVEKAIKDAKKNFVRIPLTGSTIPHQIEGSYRSSKVFMAPAADGTGVIAGSAVRAVVECVGVKNILTKVYGSTNPVNVVKAAMRGLLNLRSREEVVRLRGVDVS